MLMRKVTNMIVINTPVPNLMVASSNSCLPMAMYPKANIRTTVAIIASAVLAKTEIFNIVLTLLFHVALVLSFCVGFYKFFSIILSNIFDKVKRRNKNKAVCRNKCGLKAIYYWEWFYQYIRDTNELWS